MTPTEETIYNLTMDSMLLWVIGVNDLGDFSIWNPGAFTVHENMTIVYVDGWVE